MGFAIGGDGEFKVLGSKSKEGDDPTKGYEAIQTRSAARKKKRERAAGKPATSLTKKKRVKKSSGTKGSVAANKTQACELSCLLGRALNAVKHHEENDYPKESDCTALLPMASKMAKVYEPCSKLILHTELMEGLGRTYSENYDTRPRR